MGRGCIVAIALAIAGCHASEAPAIDTVSTSSSTSTSGSSSTDSDASSSSVSIEDGPPVVVDIGKSAAFVGEGERTTITAFVDHPRGASAVVEGVLVGPGDPAEYGAFVHGVNGRWSIEVGWEDADARMDLSFEDELVIEFVARFVDDAGLVGEGTIELPHQCSPLEPTACKGECADLSISPIHCGECDHPCEGHDVTDGFPVGGCSAGVCSP